MNHNRRSISPRLGHFRRLAVSLFVVVAAAGTALGLASTLPSPPPFSVYPVPGSRVVPPSAQIVFRGVTLHRLRKVVVTGSSTGVHTGTLRADSDGQGGSFVPDKPFQPGETVTVAAALKPPGAWHGTFQYTVATPAGPIPSQPMPLARRTSGDIQRFHTEPAMSPAAVNVSRHGRTRMTGDIFVAPQQGPVQNGPMILDQGGGLIWFKPLPANTQATDFRVQRYQGKPVLTWWQGSIRSGSGVGEGMIVDRSYRQIATVAAANGLSADLHEFTLTPRGTALITAYYPVWWDGSSAGAAKRQVVMDSVVQEIDVKTGLLLFQWDSLDHVPLSDSYTAPPTSASYPLDSFHVNSVEEDGDRNLLISARNTSAIYKVDRQTGQIIWTLGGKHSSFKMGPGTAFGFQHDARISPHGDDVVTLFDDGGGPPRLNPRSRAITLHLDVDHKSATRVSEESQLMPAPADYEGNQQRFPDGGAFVGWGEQPYFTEFDSHGQTVLEGRFVAATANYRAYLEPWSSRPATVPAVRTSVSGDHTTVFVSWNGATDVASWRVLTGDAAGDLRPSRTAPKQGFETAIDTTASTYIEVQALDATGRVLATSPRVKAA